MFIKQFKANQGDKHYYLFVKSFHKIYFDWKITLKAGEVFIRGQVVRQKDTRVKTERLKVQIPPLKRPFFIDQMNVLHMNQIIEAI
jgi:hypothetical protein